MSAGVLREMNGLLVEQVDAFAAVLEQRDLARDVAVQLEQENARLREFAEWVVSMDATDYWLRAERATLSLTDIIGRARQALGESTLGATGEQD